MKTTKRIRLPRKTRKLPGRRFIEFPEVKGKTAEKSASLPPATFIPSPWSFKTRQRCSYKSNRDLRCSASSRT